jgi:hypothetical protein
MSILMAVLNLLAEISWFQCGLTVSAYDYCVYYVTAPNNNTKSDRESSAKCPATKCHQYKHTHTHTHLCDRATSF